jgi:hypothetical protein
VTSRLNPQDAALPRARSWWIVAALLVPIGIFVERAFRIALERYYSIDEFQYAHAGWLVSRGAVPYRDFFQHYMPLLYQSLAVPFLFLNSDPTAMRALRVIAFPIVLWIAYSCYRINSSSDGAWAFLTPMFLLSINAFVTRAVELRPDGYATALFFSAIALLSGGKPVSRRRAFLAGALAGASFLASQKALYYCLAFVVALAIDVVPNRRRRRFLLGDPAGFVAGAAAVLFAFAIFLTATRAWPGWVEHAVRWSIYHQRHYYGFPFARTFVPVFLENRFLFLLALIGLAVSFRRMFASGRAGVTPEDVLPVLALGSTFASFALTRAPHVYCLVPFFPALCVFSARGAVALGRRSTAGRAAPVLRIALALVLASELVEAYQRLDVATMNRNDYQQATLARVAALTREDEPVFDNSGAAVARPHVLFHYYGDDLHLHLRAKELESQAPAEMLRKGCVLVLFERRFVVLPPKLLAFISENYQPYDGDLRLWGRRYRIEGRQLKDQFYAIRDGRYFVSPASALDDGKLLIDGRRVLSSTFTLTRGMKSVEYSGSEPQIYLLWLPANGVRYTPRPGLPPRFLTL